MPDKLKILSWNIKGCRGLNNKINIDQVAQTIIDTEADIVFLSEVDANWERSDFIDQPKLLQEKTKHPFTTFHPSLTITQPKGPGYYGNALLSKYKIENDEATMLPNPANDEQRTLLSANLNIDGEYLFILGTHLSIVEQERLSQVDVILDVAKKQKFPTLLMGDFNATPDSTEIQKLTEDSFLDTASFNIAEFTFPSPNPTSRIDYIFAEPSLYKQVYQYSTIKTKASDHYGIAIELKFPLS